MRTLVLLLLLSLAGAAATLPWLLPDPVKPLARADAVAPSRATTQTLPDLPPLERLTVTATRPLFAPTRRPPADDTVSIALSDADRSLILGRYAKTGVVVTKARRIVMLRDTVENKALRLKEGDRLEGWLIEAIGFATLVLRDGDNTLEFDLTNSKEGE